MKIFEPETVAKATRHAGKGLPLDRKLLMPMRYSHGFMLGATQASLYGWNHPRLFGHVGMSNLWTWADPDRDLVVAAAHHRQARAGALTCSRCLS